MAVPPLRKLWLSPGRFCLAESRSRTKHRYAPALDSQVVPGRLPRRVDSPRGPAGFLDRGLGGNWRVRGHGYFGADGGALCRGLPIGLVYLPGDAAALLGGYAAVRDAPAGGVCTQFCMGVNRAAVRARAFDFGVVPGTRCAVRRALR